MLLWGFKWHNGWQSVSGPATYIAGGQEATSSLPPNFRGGKEDRVAIPSCSLKEHICAYYFLRFTSKWSSSSAQKGTRLGATGQHLISGSSWDSLTFLGVSHHRRENTNGNIQLQTTCRVAVNINKRSITLTWFGKLFCTIKKLSLCTQRKRFICKVWKFLWNSPLKPEILLQ